MDKESDEYNDPDRGRFFLKNKNILAVTMFAGGTVRSDSELDHRVCGFSGPGFYNADGYLVQHAYRARFLDQKGRIRRIKDIPCSKTLSVTGGWVAVTTFFAGVGFRNTLYLQDTLCDDFCGGTGFHPVRDH